MGLMGLGAVSQVIKWELCFDGSDEKWSLVMMNGCEVAARLRSRVFFLLLDVSEA